MTVRILIAYGRVADGGLDEMGPDPLAPTGRFHEQNVQFCRSVFPKLDGGKARLPSFIGRHKYVTLLDLMGRQLDGVGMGEQGIAIFLERKGGAPLQRLKCNPLIQACSADHCGSARWPA